jgi:2'-5' RNA ligase
MRLFIAVTIPQNIKESIVEAIKPLGRLNCDAKWVELQNIHITLKFLGETPEELLEKIKAIMQHIAGGYHVVYAQLTEFGFFPDARRPRVFFITTDNEAFLKHIADALEENLEKLGFKKENRFRAHVTLARFKTFQSNDIFAQTVKRIHVTEGFPISAITLFKSTLGFTGPTYEEVFTAHFKS